MSDSVTLSCPSCAAKLQVTSDIDRFACEHCGTEQIVRRGGGLVSLAPVIAEMKHVSAGVDRTASELAIRRLTGEIAALEKQKITADAGCGTAVRGLGLPLLVIVVGIAIATSITDGTAQLLVLVVSIVIAGMVFFVLLVTPTKKGALRVAKIEERIQERRREIAQHRRYVSLE